MWEIFEKCFKSIEKGTLEREKMKDHHFDVVLMINCAGCGSDDEIMWFALHPS